MKTARHIRTLRERFSTPEHAPRLRIVCETIGPGKARLLELIDATHSISRAARQMKMSYARAWSLVETLNGVFKKPLVLSAPGGKRGGGSRLSATGTRVLRLYGRIRARCLAASRRDMKALHRLLKV